MYVRLLRCLHISRRKHFHLRLPYTYCSILFFYSGYCDIRDNMIGGLRPPWMNELMHVCVDNVDVWCAEGLDHFAADSPSRYMLSW